MIEINEFYDFGSKLLSSTFQAGAVGLKTQAGKGPILADHWELIKGNFFGINFPVVFKQDYGKKLLDILDTGWPSLYLISDHLKNTLETNKLTGWKSYPARVYDKKGVEVMGYNGFSITGRCGPIDYTKRRSLKRGWFLQVLFLSITKVYMSVLINGTEVTFFSLKGILALLSPQEQPRHLMTQKLQI